MKTIGDHKFQVCMLADWLASRDDLTGFSIEAPEAYPDRRIIRATVWVDRKFMAVDIDAEAPPDSEEIARRFVGAMDAIEAALAREKPKPPGRGAAWGSDTP